MTVAARVGADRMTTTESVVVLDDDVQAAWRLAAQSGAVDLASSYVLSTAIVGLAQAGIAGRLTEDWTPSATLIPPN